MDDHPIFECHADIVEDVKAGLARRSAARAATSEDGHAVVGAALVNPFTVALIESTVRSALEYAAQSFGPVATAGILAWKDQIRAVVGPAVLQMVDTMIHGLQDAKVAPAGS